MHISSFLLPFTATTMNTKETTLELKHLMPSYLLFFMGLIMFVDILMSKFYMASDFYLNRKNCVRYQNLQFCTFSDFSDQCVFNISIISLFFFIVKDIKSF